MWARARAAMERLHPDAAQRRWVIKMLEIGTQSELPKMHTAFLFAIFCGFGVVGGADLAPFNETNETSLNLLNYKVGWIYQLQKNFEAGPQDLLLFEIFDYLSIV